MAERGEIWIARLGRGGGRSPGKTRPVLLVQAKPLIDVGHPTTLVIPLTTNLADDAAPLRVRIPAQGKLSEDSDLLVDQIRSVDNRRLVRGPLALLSTETMELVTQAIGEVLDVPVRRP